METLKLRNIDTSQWPRWAGGTGVLLHFNEVVNGLKVEGEDIITSIRKHDTWKCYSRLTELKLNSTSESISLSTRKTKLVATEPNQETKNNEPHILNGRLEIIADARKSQMEAAHFTAALVFSAALVVLLAAVTSEKKNF